MFLSKLFNVAGPAHQLIAGKKNKENKIYRYWMCAAPFWHPVFPPCGGPIVKFVG